MRGWPAAGGQGPLPGAGRSSAQRRHKGCCGRGRAAAPLPQPQLFGGGGGAGLPPEPPPPPPSCLPRPNAQHPAPSAHPFPPGFIPYRSLEAGRLKGAANGDLSGLVGATLTARVVTVRAEAGAARAGEGGACAARPAPRCAAPMHCPWQEPYGADFTSFANPLPSLLPPFQPAQVSAERKELLLSERLVGAAAALAGVSEGDVVEGVVTSVEDFGAFVTVRACRRRSVTQHTGRPANYVGQTGNAGRLTSKGEQRLERAKQSQLSARRSRRSQRVRAPGWACAARRGGGRRGARVGWRDRLAPRSGRLCAACHRPPALPGPCTAVPSCQSGARGCRYCWAAGWAAGSGGCSSTFHGRLGAGVTISIDAVSGVFRTGLLAQHPICCKLFSTGTGVQGSSSRGTAAASAAKSAKAVQQVYERFETACDDLDSGLFDLDLD
jgi:hypothetical protein